MSKKAIILAGSSGIGKAIANSLKAIKLEVITTSSSELDTSNLDQVKKFINVQKNTDILVLNTGGPPSKNFFDITENDWNKYHSQLFLSFTILLQKLKINKGGYIFLISSYNIKEPDPKLILSNSYRVAFTSVLKSLSASFANEEISCINIAPGPIKTRRLESLVSDMKSFEEKLPMKRAGKAEEIGNFVSSIISNNIKYLTGVTINFDGGKSKFLF